MSELILTLNVGSSSLKAAAYPLQPQAAPLFTLEIDLLEQRLHASGDLPPALATPPHVSATADLALWLARGLRTEGHTLAACAHRIVHGGPWYTRATRITPAVLARLESLSPLCPLHQPPALAVVQRLQAALPELLQVACFDTAFHATQPHLATRYALPASVTGEQIRGYGFHGLSCQSALRQLAVEAPLLSGQRLLIAHLGSGASLTAVRHGQSIATTMGFSTLEGLPMATRCGHLDPGLLLHLMAAGWQHADLEQLLYRESGLLGLSGISGDLRTLLALDVDEARQAVDYFCYRIAREAGSLVSAMEGLDAIVFTGGIGEHQPAIRQQVAERLGWLGCRLDDEANRNNRRRVDAPDATVAVLVLPADEQGELRDGALACLAGP